MSSTASNTFRQFWPHPRDPRPIVIIGAGGIVRDAHLPAYRKAGFPVAGVYDVNRAQAEALAEDYAVRHVFDSLEAAVAQPDVVFDVAVPPEHALAVISSLPTGATVLMQKPMGTHLADAGNIRDVCRNNRLTAAVNFQLRFAPIMLVVRDACDRGLLGELLDIEFRLNIRTPWEQFAFLEKLDRVEIQIHSVHYLDLVRSFLGEPRGVYARTVRHPAFPKLKSTRTSAILDYGDQTRVCFSLNHNYAFGPEHEEASVFFQGTKGAALVCLGTLMDYPQGRPETVRIATDGDGWRDIPVAGKWFPDAFAGTMSNLQRFAAGEDPILVSHFDDAYHTMALVEACYESDRSGATPIAT